MPVRVGILGAGQMGRTHGELLARDGRAAVVGVADPDAPVRCPTSRPSSPRGSISW